VLDEGIGMKTATGLTLVAIGAILAFAVTAHLKFLDLQVVGWVIILTGLAGIFIPRGGYGRLRKRVAVRRTPRGGLVRTVEEAPNAPYLLNPGPPTVEVEDVAPEYDIADPDVPLHPGSETIEEYFEE
jgi:Domain of unknown function (DUF6458)